MKNRKLFCFITGNHFEKELICLFSGILLIQLSFIIFFNFTQLKYHMGYDASSAYLQVIEMWKQGTFYPKNWSFQTMLYWDTPSFLAFFLYGITKNIFVAFAFSNVINAFILGIMLFVLLKEMNASVLARLVSLALVFCPYLSTYYISNDLGYFSMMFVSNGLYVVKMIIILLILYACLLFNKSKLNHFESVSILLSYIIVFFSGMSSGLYLLFFIIVPSLIYYIVKALIGNNLRELLVNQVFYLLLCSLLIVAGRIIAIKSLGFASTDFNMSYMTVDLFFTNMNKLFAGFFLLFGAMQGGSSVNLLTKMAIFQICNLFILVSLIVSFGRSLYKSIKGFVNNYFTKITIATAFLFLMLFLISDVNQTTYYQIRYLIPFLYFLVILLARMIDDTSWRFVFKKLFLCMLAFSLIISSIASYSIIYSAPQKYAPNNYTIMSKVKEYVSTYSTPIVYFYGSKNFGIISRNIRPFDTSKIYKMLDDNLTVHHWGDYTYYDDSDEFPGEVLLVTSESDFINLPEEIQNSFFIEKTIEDSMHLYKSNVNVFDFK